MLSERVSTCLVAAVVVAIAATVGWRESHVAHLTLSRRQLFAELTPVALSNCQMQRFGDAHDGGYALCANLLAGVRSGYSYGIANTDNWGCQVSQALKIPMHEYDCFDLRAPTCAGGQTIFHGECVGPIAKTEDGRTFDSIEHQLQRNGDALNHIVLKMDVERSEWDSLAATPDTLFERVDQLVVEFHYVDERYIPIMRRLHQFFYLAHVHYNNFTCWPAIAPFPSWAYETLWVNKRLGVPDPSRPATVPAGIDAPNDPTSPDCQPVKR